MVEFGSPSSPGYCPKTLVCVSLGLLQNLPFQDYNKYLIHRNRKLDTCSQPLYSLQFDHVTKMDVCSFKGSLDNNGNCFYRCFKDNL